jgi:hypothetical protein
MPCTWICGKPLKRFHWSCLFCRLRRYEAGQLNHADYERAGPVVVPRDREVYLLYIDRKRRFRRLKDQLMGKLLNIVELLAN